MEEIPILEISRKAVAHSASSVPIRVIRGLILCVSARGRLLLKLPYLSTIRRLTPSDPLVPSVSSPLCKTRELAILLVTTMFNPDDFQYAMDNTQVIMSPERRIETFGSVNFHFYLISELMDQANRVRVRDGQIQAERPQILTAENCARVLLEGFGDSAKDFADWLQRQRENMALLKYGFQFRKSNVAESVVQSPLADVIERVREQVTAARHPCSAIIQGVDDAWEVCLLKFTMELVRHSASDNMGDFRKRGLM